VYEISTPSEKKKIDSAGIESTNLSDNLISEDIDILDLSSEKAKTKNELLKDAFKSGVRELFFTRSFEKAFDKFQEVYKLGIDKTFGGDRGLSFEKLVDLGVYKHKPNNRNNDLTK
jgi:hypothetical protein